LTPIIGIRPRRPALRSLAKAGSVAFHFRNLIPWRDVPHAGSRPSSLHLPATTERGPPFLNYLVGGTRFVASVFSNHARKKRSILPDTANFPDLQPTPSELDSDAHIPISPCTFHPVAIEYPKMISARLVVRRAKAIPVIPAFSSTEPISLMPDIQQFPDWKTNGCD